MKIRCIISTTYDVNLEYYPGATTAEEAIAIDRKSYDEAGYADLVDYATEKDELAVTWQVVEP